MTIKSLLAAAILFSAASWSFAQTAPAVVGNGATHARAVTSVPYTAHTKAKAKSKSKAKADAKTNVKAKPRKVKYQPKNQKKVKAHAVKAKKSHGTT